MSTTASWSKQQQAEAEATYASDKQTVANHLQTWWMDTADDHCVSNLLSVEGALNTWRGHIKDLLEKSGNVMDHHVDTIGVLATQVADEKLILQKLRSEAGTRVDQANTVNPKIVGIPATNILGLNRVFRSSTRLALLIFSIVLGVLAGVGIVYFVYASGVVQKTVGLIRPDTINFVPK
jgi:hypothetical protein